MSVIVMGMDMPENCHVCGLCFGGLCYAIPPEVDEMCPDEDRPDWCPIRPLPERHGRLIDAVELWNQLEEMRSEERERNGEKSVYYVMASMAMAMVAAQDTIVEAEGD